MECTPVYTNARPMGHGKKVAEQCGRIGCRISTRRSPSSEGRYVTVVNKVTSCWISWCVRNLTSVLVLPMSPPVASSSSEEEERLELDYADDPPIPCVEGTVQGTGCRVSERLSKANSPVVDWDGALSEYLTPHLTPESGSNILIPLPGRWSGGYCLCILLITGYRFQTDNICSFQNGWRRSRSWRVISFLQSSYSDSATTAIKHSKPTVQGWCYAKIIGTLRCSPLPWCSLPICPTTSGWPAFSAVACHRPSCLLISRWQSVGCWRLRSWRRRAQCWSCWRGALIWVRCRWNWCSCHHCAGFATFGSFTSVRIERWYRWPIWG